MIGIHWTFLPLVIAEETETTAPMKLGLVPSWPIDLTMNQEEERAIVQRLLATCPPLPSSMSLEEFASELESVVPVHLDTTALQGIGLTPDVRVLPLRYRKGTSWLSQIDVTLKSVDLTVQLRHKILHLTTEEETQNNYPTRVYNITCLVGAGEIEHRRSGVDSLMGLLQTHVVPDAWEALGGTGTMTASFHGQESLLMVSASTPMHWQIQASLNQMMIAGKVPVFQLQSIGNQLTIPQPDQPPGTQWSGLPTFRP